MADRGMQIFLMRWMVLLVPYKSLEDGWRMRNAWLLLVLSIKFFCNQKAWVRLRLLAWLLS